jgi:hypothetical protein
MTEQLPPKSDPLLKNPQVLAAIIGGFFTLMVAILSIVPTLMSNRAPEPTPTVIIVTATSVPATAVVQANSTDLPTTEPTRVNTSVPPTSMAENMQVPPTAAPSEFIPTQTSLPTDTPPQPTALPVLPTSTPAPPGNVLLLYDDVSFTVRNQDSRTLSLEGVVFRSASGEWEARRWGPSIYNSVPAGKCLRLRDATVGQRQPPSGCVNNIYALMEVGTTAFFWLGVDQFDVVRDGAVIATCATVDQSCLIYLP